MRISSADHPSARARPRAVDWNHSTRAVENPGRKIHRSLARAAYAFSDCAGLSNRNQCRKGEQGGGCAPYRPVKQQDNGLARARWRSLGMRRPPNPRRRKRTGARRISRLDLDKWPSRMSPSGRPRHQKTASRGRSAKSQSAPCSMELACRRLLHHSATAKQYCTSSSTVVAPLRYKTLGKPKPAVLCLRRGRVCAAVRFSTP